MSLRPDLAVIAQSIPRGARVLDIGCGDGSLMAELTALSGVDARGMEIDAEHVERCVARGLSVIQGDADRDLVDYPDKSFDVAILSQTLQTTRRPDLMLDQLLRVGRQAFVSFPNFGHWRMRAGLALGGRMPVTRAMPVTWYETANIHHMTIKDFNDLLALKGVNVEGCWFFAHDAVISSASANWRAEYALYQLSR
ncbi:methionine biosynthesis protein MetW [Erythrobacteraceae bacterium E2-1 Yellow Sea]|nr:methionine biosynthesis protein MetW [Erythrobacteraceae bacterium E2-1 Yellow Sea]